jgi:hypothetical protein
MAYYFISVEESGPPLDGDIVIVSGGTAQYRDGEWFTGMEQPQFQRPIEWKVTHYMPIPIFGRNDFRKDPYEVVIKHTDLGEIKAALALAERKLKRAEALGVVLCDALDPFAGFACDDWETHQCFNCLAKRAVKQYRDKQLEDILGKPATFLPKCSNRENVGSVGMCRQSLSVYFNKPCSKRCVTPTKGEIE